MAHRYYRPTLVFPPSAEREIANHAHAAGEGVQEFMRNAVLSALTGNAPIAAPPPCVVPSLNRIHQQLLHIAAALQNITDALGDIDGTEDTETPAAIAASDAAAAHGQRVAGRILRGVEQPPGRAGESLGGSDATDSSTAQIAGRPPRKTKP